MELDDLLFGGEVDEEPDLPEMPTNPFAFNANAAPLRRTVAAIYMPVRVKCLFG